MAIGLRLNERSSVIDVCEGGGSHFLTSNSGQKELRIVSFGWIVPAGFRSHGNEAPHSRWFETPFFLRSVRIMSLKCQVVGQKLFVVYVVA